MFARTAFRILFAVLVIAALISFGVYIYNIGVAQGMAAGAAIERPEGAPPVYPYYGPFFRPWGFGFFPFGWIFGLLFIFLLFGLLRALFFRGWYRGGYWGEMHGRSPHDVPPAVEEWHRRMHGESPSPSGDR